MEAIAALGLAANVLQFVEFATSLVTTADGIRNSAKRHTPQSAHIADTTNRLRVLAAAVQQTSGKIDTKSESYGEAKMLNDICRGCLELADELSQHLAKLEKLESRVSRFKSYRLAFEAIRDKPTIDSLFHRLTMFRGEIDTFMLAAISRQLSDTDSAQSSALGVLMDRTIRQEHEETRRQIMGALLGLAQSGLQTQYPEGVSTSYVDAKQMAHDLAKRMVVESLWFPALNRRFDMVPESHKRTFEWIFNDDPHNFGGWTNFPRWLRHSNGVYWINGKAGSGKSTLMKFLVLDPRLRSNLQMWAGNDTLVCSHHFFWRKGEGCERSITGLLKTILLNLFRHAPSLVEHVLKDRLEMAEEGLTEHIYLTQERPTVGGALPLLPGLMAKLENWSIKDLTMTLERLTKEKVPGFKFFFLIDGLDEFEGDHEEILNMLRLISFSDNMKVCLSSRPLPLFQQVLGQGPRLMLQDLTSGDISIFVHDKLANNQELLALVSENRRKVQHLANNITAKACGVFLWVTLVVKSLMLGLVNCDRFEDLEKRLDALPPDLEDLYWHMIRSIDPIYKARASMIFQVCQRTIRSPTALVMSMMLENYDEDTVLRAPRKLIKPEEVEERVNNVDMRLRSICAGLLEVQDSGMVMFLHATVGDFFDNPEVHKELRGFADAAMFNPDMAIVKTSILRLKWTTDDSYSTESPNRNLDAFWAIIEEALCAATRADREGQDLSIELMDTFDNEAVFTWARTRTEMDGVGVHWSNFLQDPARHFAPSQRKEIFLHCAVRFQLNSYLRNRLLYHPHKLLNLTKEPLLCAAIPIPRHERGIFQLKPAPQLPNPTTIELLLQAGENPNLGPEMGSDNGQKNTPYINALHHLFVDFNPFKAAYGSTVSERYRVFGHHWSQVLELLLRHGADPDVILYTHGAAAAFAYAKKKGREGDVEEADETIRRSSLAVVRDILRLFDPEGAARLEARLIKAGVEYISMTSSGQAVIPKQNPSFQDQELPTASISLGKPRRLRSIYSAPGDRLNLRRAAMERDGGFFMDVII